jgi:hypothetical protein
MRRGAIDLLDLQRLAGNEAVAHLVQRAPGDRPASTDARGARYGSCPGVRLVSCLARLRARAALFHAWAAPNDVPGTPQIRRWRPPPWGR